jgi:vancomycin permeability regulator SanA
MKNNLIWKWTKRLVLLGMLWLVGHLGYLVADGVPDTKAHADVAIVLGNYVFPNGQLSSWLKGRVDKALELYEHQQVRKIFVSGGIDAAGTHEGTAMKNYLVQKGVPEADVIADDSGANTYMTAKNYVAWNQALGFDSVIVVSQFYHITRCKYILKKLGVQHITSASSDRYSSRDLLSTLREVPAFYKYWLFDREDLEK